MSSRQLILFLWVRRGVHDELGACAIKVLPITTQSEAAAVSREASALELYRNTTRTVPGAGLEGLWGLDIPAGLNPRKAFLITR